tara:strand:- start:4276 stop:5178 length:903 start_codon:yes stop_codon:yes gene_type:complete
MIRLLYELTKQGIRKMRTRELDDIERQLDSVERDAARYGMSDKNRERFDATRNAIREEKGIRAVRDEEYGIMQDELRGASELIPVDRSSGGIQSIARGDLENVPYPNALFKSGKNQHGQQSSWYVDPKTNDAYKLGKEGDFEKVSSPALTPSFVRLGNIGNKADDVIPEFSTQNLTKVEVESGVPGQAYSLDERAGWMGPRISEQGNPLKLQNMTFGQLDEAQQGVYRIVKEADIPELSDPGVLSDLLDYTRRAGRGRSPNEIVSEYWETKGRDIREYLDIRTTTGEIPPGMTMEDFLKL